MSRERLWLFLAVALPVLGATLATMSTVDLAYQVRAGDLMLASGSILRTDPFTFTAGGEPWLNQQWGTGILLAISFGPAGWAGLAVLRAALVGLAFGLVLAGARLGGAGARGAALLSLSGFVVALPALALRAQLFGIVLFALVLALLAARGRYPASAWAVPFVVVAWANLHGSFFLGPAAVAVALLDDALARRPGVMRLAVVLALALAATVVSPFGAGTWEYALGLVSNPSISSLVSEWQRTSPLTVAGLLFYLSLAGAAGLAAAAWRRGWRPGWPSLAWLVTLALMGAWAERGVAWWAVGAPVGLAPAVAVLAAATSAGTGGRSGAGADPGRARPEPPALRLVNLLLAGLIALAIIVLQPAWRPSDPLTGPGGLLTDAPAGMATALAGAAGPSDRVFNAQRWGSWLEWAAPGVPLMVDSRIEVVPEAAWGDYLAISSGAPDWAARLDRWDVTAVVASRDEQAALLPLIAADPGWRRLHADADGELFVRAP
jgi:hypothetical protein